MAPGVLTMVVGGMAWLADGVRGVRLVPLGGAELPPWDPGAHLTLQLPGGETRQYSLCGDPAERAFYEIAVLRDPHSRGGSAWVHDTLKPGRRPAGLVEPIFEYTHREGTSITGGYVYRGDRIPSLRGAYLYSDYGVSTLRAIVAADTKVAEASTLATTGVDPEQIVSFGQDAKGELYALSFDGLVSKLVPPAAKTG